MGIDPPPEEVLSTRTIYQGEVLHFKKITVNSSVVGIKTREIVEHPGAVTLVPIIGDKLILIRQFRLAAGKTIYELPAGTMMPGESPKACARREVVEETGYSAGELQEFYQCYLAPGYSTELMHFYLATKLKLGVQHLDEDEAIGVYPTSMKEALDMIKKNVIVEAKTAVGLLLYNELKKSAKANS